MNASVTDNVVVRLIKAASEAVVWTVAAALAVAVVWGCAPTPAPYVHTDLRMCMERVWAEHPVWDAGAREDAAAVRGCFAKYGRKS